MSGRGTPGTAAAAAAAGPDAVRLAQDAPEAAGSTAGTDAVTTQYRKMSVSDGVPAGQAALSGGPLPELMPDSQTDEACLSSNPEASVRLCARASAVVV